MSLGLLKGKQALEKGNSIGLLFIPVRAGSGSKGTIAAVNPVED